jgi:hypothetical protein
MVTFDISVPPDHFSDKESKFEARGISRGVNVLLSRVIL